jgi:hypothetical protein
VSITAEEMAKKRWKGVTKKQRQDVGKMLAAARNAVMTPEQRSAIAKKAAAARWGTRKQVVKSLKAATAKKKAAKE